MQVNILSTLMGQHPDPVLAPNLLIEREIRQAHTRLELGLLPMRMMVLISLLLSTPEVS